MYGVLRCTFTILYRILEDYKQIFFFTNGRDLKGCPSERSETTEVFLFLFGTVCSSLKLLQKPFSILRLLVQQLGPSDSLQKFLPRLSMDNLVPNRVRDLIIKTNGRVLLCLQKHFLCRESKDAFWYKQSECLWERHTSLEFKRAFPQVTVNYLQLNNIYDLLNVVNVAEPYKMTPNRILRGCLAIFSLT